MREARVYFSECFRVNAQIPVASLKNCTNILWRINRPWRQTSCRDLALPVFPFSRMTKKGKKNICAHARTSSWPDLHTRYHNFIRRLVKSRLLNTLTSFFDKFQNIVTQHVIKQETQRNRWSILPPFREHLAVTKRSPARSAIKALIMSRVNANNKRKSLKSSVFQSAGT